MLKFFRKHARGWFMIAVIAIIIVVFVLYFGSSRGGEHARVVATVDKKVITVNAVLNEYDKLLEMARLNLKENLTPDLIKKMDLKTKAYNDILNREVIIAKAADLKIHVSDDELRNSILSMPALQTNGAFDERKYHQILRLNRLSAEDFEALQRADLTAGKIEILVREGIKISDKEIYDLYALQNRKINVDFLRLAASDVKYKISPVESELENYLKRNGSLFRVPEQAKIKYLFFGADTFPTAISDADIQDHYSTYQNKYKAKDGKPLPLAGVRNDIINELKRAKGMQTAYAEARKAREEIYQNDNMDAFARKHNLAVRDSDFFTITRPPQEFASVKNFVDALLSMQKGELSKILSTENGYYLLQVVDKKASYIPKLGTIANEVRQRFIETETQLLAGKEARSILESLKAGESMEKVASAKGLKIGQTGFFQPGNAIPGVGESPEAAEILMTLSAANLYAEKPLFINNAYYILKFREATRVDDNAFATGKDIYRKILTAMKQEEAMQTWLEGNKADMIKGKRIKIKKKAEEL